MKRILSIAGILSIALLFTSAISIGEMPQDPPKGKKAKKHIKMVKIGEDGKKMELDTVIEGDNVFVFNGDTIGAGSGFAHFADEDFDFDTDIDFDVKQDGKGNVVVMRSGKGSAPAIYEFKTEEGDSVKKVRVKVIGGDDEDIMKWHSKTGNEMMLGAPHGAHKMMIIGDHKKANVIDLSDPGIISYDKKDLKDGKEKIVIVRKKPSENEKEIHEEIIIHGAGTSPMMWHDAGSSKSKRIKVISDDSGKVEIIEDGKVWDIDESDEDVQVIEEDGKKIIIKRIKEGGEMKVNVEVEEIEEKK